jgi:hypothetical protein
LPVFGSGLRVITACAEQSITHSSPLHGSRVSGRPARLRAASKAREDQRRPRSPSGSGFGSGEGQSRTGDTTIFSQGNGSHGLPGVAGTFLTGPTHELPLFPAVSAGFWSRGTSCDQTLRPFLLNGGRSFASGGDSLSATVLGFVERSNPCGPMKDSSDAPGTPRQALASRPNGYAKRRLSTDLYRSSKAGS